MLNAPGSMEMAFSQPTMSLINLLAYPWEGTLAEKTSPLAPEDWRALLEEAEKRALTLTLYYRLRVAHGVTFGFIIFVGKMEMMNANFSGDFFVL